MAVSPPRLHQASSPTHAYTPKCQKPSTTRRTDRPASSRSDMRSSRRPARPRRSPAPRAPPRGPHNSVHQTHHCRPLFLTTSWSEAWMFAPYIPFEITEADQRGAPGQAASSLSGSGFFSAQLLAMRATRRPEGAEVQFGAAVISGEGRPGVGGRRQQGCPGTGAGRFAGLKCRNHLPHTFRPWRHAGLLN